MSSQLIHSFFQLILNEFSYFLKNEKVLCFEIIKKYHSINKKEFKAIGK